MPPEPLKRRALELRQDPHNALYVFALRPAEIELVAGISRVSRDDEHRLVGYQRKEVRKHVQDIRDYLDQGSVLFPNALILAFDAPLRFKRSRGPATDDGLATSGTLEIPVPQDGSDRPAWIVDGQQRALALAGSTNKDLAVPVAAFVGADLALQRDQFLRINNARPLPRSLVTELLPEIDTFLPRRLAARKLPSAITDLLNRHPESPFRELIKRPSSSPDERRQAVVTDTSVIDMVKARLVESSGCLFPYRNVATGETDSETVVDLLIAYWRAVRRVFPDAWGLPPTKSRLMHGAGIKAMGTLMDAIVPRHDPSAPGLEEILAEEIRRVAPLCRWTAGTWDALGGLPWNGIENTSRSVRVLSNHLVREYTLSRHRR
jgi:DGQHR domain-containing protein